MNMGAIPFSNIAHGFNHGKRIAVISCGNILRSHAWNRGLCQ